MDATLPQVTMMADELAQLSCAFVVRLWIEEIDCAGENHIWRGHITHVSSGRRQHFEQFDVMADFIVRYITELTHA